MVAVGSTTPPSLESFPYECFKGRTPEMADNGKDHDDEKSTSWTETNWKETITSITGDGHLSDDDDDSPYDDRDSCNNEPTEIDDAYPGDPITPILKTKRKPKA